MPEGEETTESDFARPSSELTDGDSLATGDDSEVDDFGARVRDRGTASCETQRYWDTLDVHNGTQCSQKTAAYRQRGQTRPYTENEFDEGLSDDMAEDLSRSRSRSPNFLNTDANADVGMPRFSHMAQDPALSRYPRKPSSRTRPQHPLRAAAPQLRDPYHFDETVSLIQAGNDLPSYTNETVSAVPADDLQGSTFWQTWFNTVNTLIGVGILSMPLAFASSGWIGGVCMFLFCGALTNWSGKLLARILAREPRLQTYADIGSYAFGPTMRNWIGLLFCFEMWMVAVALVILFGDSLSALVYGSVRESNPWALVTFKMTGFALALPTLFMPLSLLSPVSLIGIVSILFLFLVIFADGISKEHAPGSLRDPAPTTLFPYFAGLPLTFGLVMSGFSSHPVIPSLFRDMRDPRQFGRMLDLAYGTTLLLYLSVAITGYLMFGEHVSDEISRDLARTSGFPRLLTNTAVLLMVINPLTKFGLAIRPVQLVMEQCAGLEPTPPPQAPLPEAQVEEEACVGGHGVHNQSFFASFSGIQAAAEHEFDDVTADLPCLPAAILQRLPTLGVRGKRVCVRLATSLSVLLAAIVFPSMERVMGFLGAFLTFNTCIVGPFLANMVVFGHERSVWCNIRDLFILCVTFVLAVLGTLKAILP